MRALLLLPIVSFSCAHAPRDVVPVAATPELATVVFVRPAHLVGSAIAPFIIDDRLEVLGSAQNGTWFVARLPAGEHQLCAAPSPRQAANMFPPDTRASTGFSAPLSRLRLTPGSVTFVRVDVGWESFAAPRVELVPLRVGSLAEQRARASMVLGAEANAQDVTEDQVLLRARLDACVSASGDDLRLSAVH